MLRVHILKGVYLRSAGLTASLSPDPSLTLQNHGASLLIVEQLVTNLVNV